MGQRNFLQKDNHTICGPGHPISQNVSIELAAIFTLHEEFWFCSFFLIRILAIVDDKVLSYHKPTGSKSKAKEINFVSKLAEIVYKAIQPQNKKNSDKKNSVSCNFSSNIQGQNDHYRCIPLICLLEINAVKVLTRKSLKLITTSLFSYSVSTKMGGVI